MDDPVEGDISIKPETSPVKDEFVRQQGAAKEGGGRFGSSSLIVSTCQEGHYLHLKKTCSTKEIQIQMTFPKNQVERCVRKNEYIR